MKSYIFAICVSAVVVLQLVSKKMHTVATEVETGLPQYTTEAAHLMLQQPITSPNDFTSMQAKHTARLNVTHWVL